MMKSKGASLLFAVANRKVDLSAERLNSLFDYGFGLAGIFLVRGHCGSGGFRLRCTLWRLSRGRARLSLNLGPGQAHQNQNREKLFHST